MPNYHQHLFIGFFVSAILILSLHFIFHLNLINANMLTTLVIVTLIFSLLPDIDHRSSKISVFLHFLFLLVVLAFFTKLITFNFSSILIIAVVVGLEVYHLIFAKSNWKHRQFPHSFTFGFFSLIVLYLITSSWIAIFVGGITFFSHILIDGHLFEAIEKDKKFWKFFN
ncbi:hypothetical protein COV12_02340 [Candidatus Woesearchaeota archaeon CG10_big_fil_rev_8_21_14_0_10_32_24]|nr:MAG: hypothetical protein COV12_02340 [Candidatus Woesearchaeota archaeon CG10_big_fil_rev_8_21_14_0_10_32_24]